MKNFLDDTFAKLNESWDAQRPEVENAVEQFEQGVQSLTSIFEDRVAKKPTSPHFNRAIFDALIYYQAQEGIRKACARHKRKIRGEYEQLFDEDSEFLVSIESDTAGLPNTSARMHIWGDVLERATRAKVRRPELKRANARPSTAKQMPKSRGATGSRSKKRCAKNRVRSE